MDSGRGHKWLSVCLSINFFKHNSLDRRKTEPLCFLLVIYLSLAVESLPELGELREVDALAAVLVALADQGLGLALAHGAADLKYFEIQKFSFN